MTSSFSPRAIIRKKRDSLTLSDEEIQFFVKGMTEESITEAQMAAFAMTIFFNGMTPQETSALTLAMAHSGRVLDWKAFNLPGPVVDKHSSGGIGDKLSLMLAPMLAAAGAYVPMITGRGLAQTGGTTDKMESIPGYQIAPGIELFKKTTREVGCAVIGQTPDLAPADRKLYACRDNTESVACLPLIVSSILSKKIAAGAQSLVMQVNFGTGTLISDYQESRALGQALVETGRVAKLPLVGLMTDMNEVIGYSAGNGLEVEEAIAFLKGESYEPRMYELTLALGSHALMLSGLFYSLDTARARLIHDLKSGHACELFAKMVAALGGPTDLVERPAVYFPQAPVVLPLKAPRAGYILHINAGAVGMILIGLGGGRVFAHDILDHRVGISQVCHVGDWVETGHPLLMIHAKSQEDFEKAARELLQVIVLSDQKPEMLPIVREILR